MAERLKIYACSGIGDTPDSKVQMYDYWTDNTNTLNNTQAVNGLLADVNLLMAEAMYIQSLTDAEIVKRLNKIDVLVVCLDAAQNYAQHYTHLQKAGRVIGTMVAQGLFAYGSMDNQERDTHLDKLLAAFEEAMAVDELVGTPDKDFVTWFEANVTDRNKIGLSSEERVAMQSALTQAVSGIGELDWRNDAELSKYLSDAGTYFLYTFFTDAQIKKIPAKNRKKFEDKREAQRYTYNYCKGKFVAMYGSENEYKNVIRTGIVSQFGDQPEAVCEDVANGNYKTSGVGDLAVEIIVAIIAGVVSILTALITAICTAVAQSNAAKYASLDKQIVDSGVPNPDDFAGLSMENSGSTSLTAGASGMLPMLIVGGALLFALIKGKL